MALLDIPHGPISVKITLHPNGALSVEGPIHDKRWMLALLDNAKDAVRNHHLPSSQQRIAVPDGDVVVPDLIQKALA